MSKILYKALIFVVLGISISITFMISHAQQTNEEDVVEFELNNDAIYNSNRFTQVETNFDAPNNPLVDLEGYEYVTESEQLILYMNQDDLSIRIEDKKTGYVWGSSFNTEEERLNRTWRARVKSAVWITYFRKTNIREEIGEEAITTSGTSKINTVKTENGFESDITFGETGIKLKLIVRLDGKGLNVTIPSDSIEETEKYKLGNIKIYPFLGAVKTTIDDITIPGYILVPDGSGALIRYQKQSNMNGLIYSKSLYRSDVGLYDKTIDDYVMPEQSIHLPVYGMVHGVNHNAFYAVNKGGAESSRLVVYPAGKTTDFYWTFFEYIYRIQYEQPTSRDMGSVVMTQKNRTEFDASIYYEFLNEEEANYVGMANQYRNYLDKNDLLNEEQFDKKENIPMRLEILNSERKKGLLFDSRVKMTDASDVIHMVNDLSHQDIDNLRLVLRGWSKGGLTGTAPDYFPFDRKTGGKKGYQLLIDAMDELNIPTYFQMDYTRGFDNAGNFNQMVDLARRIDGDTISYEVDDYEYHLLKPSSTRKIFENTLEDFEKNNIENIALQSLGNILYSSNGRKIESRGDAIDLYQNMLKKYNGKIGLYEVNDYLLKYSDEYFDVPMYSSQHYKFTDTVPFVSLVLRTTVDAYAPFMNYFSDINDGSLRLIDYGIYPSFYITEESAHLLIDTPSKDLYSSKYSSWKNTIVDKYRFVNDALKNVTGEWIVEREVLEAGVVKNTYSNGVMIYINYLNEDITVDGIKILGNHYHVIGGVA